TPPSHRRGRPQSGRRAGGQCVALAATRPVPRLRLAEKPRPTRQHHGAAPIWTSLAWLLRGILVLVVALPITLLVDRESLPVQRLHSEPIVHWLPSVPAAAVAAEPQPLL